MPGYTSKRSSLFCKQQTLFNHSRLPSYQQVNPDTTSSSIPSLHRPDMTRTHKNNDRNHAGLANGTAVPEDHLPRYFAKSGYAGENPANTKKQGGGKGNWGRQGESELEDYDVNMNKPRRRTNSSTHAAGHSGLKTKFEAIDPEVIEYEEEVHGPRPGDGTDQQELEHMSTSSSADTMGSVEEEEGVVEKK